VSALELSDPTPTDLERPEPSPSIRPASRRALLTSGLGAAVGFVAAALGRPSAARAADGDPVVLGSASNASTNTTKITVPTASFDAVWAVASGASARALRGTATNGSSAVGVFGETATGTGVHGKATATGDGILGESSSGVGVKATSASFIGIYGYGPTIGAEGTTDSGIGVQGSSNGGIGVLGEAFYSDALGVLGQSWDNGTGVLGFSGPPDGVVPASKASTGVYGYEGGAGVGVWGVTGGTTGAGTGVKGEANSPDGIGVAGFGWNGGTGVEGTGRVGVFATSTTAGWMGIWGRHFGAGYGVAGDSVSLIGVSGSSNATDHPATVGKSLGNSTGVQGFSGGVSSTLPAAKAKTGVFGQATQDSSSRGVFGVSTSGHGVRGEATTGGAVVGVANNIAGYAFLGSGRVRFNKVSGLATIAAGTTSKTITPGTDVTTDSFVLLTPMADISTRRLWFTKDATANTITIHLSSTSASSISISWLLLS
jgi:hypothetical protein